MELSYVRYLLAKRTVDDRALNQGVLDVVRERLASCRGEGEGEVRVLDLGGGCGTMVDRLLRWGILRRASYTLVDLSPESLAHAARCAPGWERDDHAHASPLQGPSGDAQTSVRLETVCADLEQWLDDADPQLEFDLIVCNAVLDLVDVPTVVPRILERLAPGGVFWPTINFDGDTIFTPEHGFDGPILTAYHHSMDVRTRNDRPAGDSKSGRHLFEHLRRAGARIEAAGSSDWVVFARGGRYPADEAAFLHHIVHTVDAELREHPEVGSAVGAWVETRHAQIDAGELVYIAHQIDFAVSRDEADHG